MSDLHVLKAKEQPKEQPKNEKAEPTTYKPVDNFSHDEIDLIPVKQYLDLDANDTTQDKYARTIFEWAKSHGITDRSTLHTELRKLELKLGSPELGERRSVRLARYLELDRRLSDTIKEMDSYRKS